MPEGRACKKSVVPKGRSVRGLEDENKALHREICGARDGTRTRDLTITNRLLYQLSYSGVSQLTAFSIAGCGLCSILRANQGDSSKSGKISETHWENRRKVSEDSQNRFLKAEAGEFSQMKSVVMSSPSVHVSQNRIPPWKNSDPDSSQTLILDENQSLHLRPYRSSSR